MQGNNNTNNVFREDNEMMSERSNIIAKYLCNEKLSEEETRYLEAASIDSDFQQELNDDKVVLGKTDRYFELKKIDTNKAWEKVNGQVSNKKTVPLYRTFLRIAAVFVLILTTGIAVWQFNSHTRFTEYATNATDVSRPEYILPDGTKVVLSHSSVLKTPKSFNGNTREVELTGEAFFEVKPNPEKPFIIHTEKTSVKVLGTSFNVYAYKANSTVEVFVKTGKVQFSETEIAGETKGQAVILTPGEKGVYNKAEQRLFKNNVNNPNAMSWLTHEIKFELTPLSEVVATLQRTYNVTINIDNNIDMSQQITATFNKQEIDFIIEVVALTYDLKITKNSSTDFVLSSTN